MNPAYEKMASVLGKGEADAAIRDYLSTGGQNIDPALVPWCAAAVNASLAQTGQEGTGSNMARSFLKWGQEVTDPQRGDVAVFSRGDPNGPYGHVGFFDGYNDDGTIRVLGGNQGDSVSVASYSPDQLLGFRRASTSDGSEADAGIVADRNPARLAWAYANGKMTPEDAAIYERGMSEGMFPAAQKSQVPDPMEVYAATAMRPRAPFQPMQFDNAPVQNATPWRQS